MGSSSKKQLQDFEEFWTDLTPPTKKRSGTMMRVEEPAVDSVDRLVEWGTNLLKVDRLPVQVIPGPTIKSRSGLLKKYLAEEWQRFRPGVIEDIVLSTEWTVEGALKTLTKKIEGMEVPKECRQIGFRVDPPWGKPWELLWGVVGVEHFLLDEPFRSMVDQNAYLVSDMFRLIMEARFLAKESNRPSIERFLGLIVRWMQGATVQDDEETLARLHIERRVENVYQRFDVLCFLLILDAQNCLLNRVILAFDGLEYVSRKEHRSTLNELYLMLQTVQRWTKVGSFPFGVLIGWTATPGEQASLRKVHPQLSEILKQGLVWTHEV